MGGGLLTLDLLQASRDSVDKNRMAKRKRCILNLCVKRVVISPIERSKLSKGRFFCKNCAILCKLSTFRKIEVNVS